MATSNERKRQLARERYQRIQRREAQRRQQRRRGLQITGVIVAIVVIAGAVAGLTLTGSSGTKKTAKAASTPAAAASATPSATQEPCAYTKSGTAAKNVGLPTYDATTAKQPYTATITTNRGTITFTALTTAAPCTTNSFKFLAQKDFFNNTPCHRLTTSGIYVLQCGDPTGTGSGGPGYQFPDENLTGATYPAGTVAMANSGPNTNGSQFFLVYKNGSQLSPAYTPFGKITSGLDVLTRIAGKGVSGGGTDGKPAESVQIEKVTIKQG